MYGYYYYNNYYNNHYPAHHFRQRLSADQAIQIALQRIPGQVLHVDLEMENGVLVYEIYILSPQNKIYEVEVNSRTGRIIKIEEEDDFD